MNVALTVRQEVGNGWCVHHLTERVVKLVKDDYAYRRITGSNGYVIVRGEPGLSREHLVMRAVELAKQNDNELVNRVGKQLIPSQYALAEYHGKQASWEPVWCTPEDQSQIGRKRI